MNEKFRQIWETKNKNDEWWSSFVTSPIAVLANWFIIDYKFLTPNLITFFSLVIALLASGLIVVGGEFNFLIAAILINISHILDCMDGQLAKYRGLSSRFGNYFDKVTDQVQVYFWFCAIAYAAYKQTNSVIPIFLAFTGVSFYSLRVYVKYVTIFIEVEHNKNYIENSAKEAQRIRVEDKTQNISELNQGWKKNFIWFIGEQRKFLLFNEAVFVFMLSISLVLNIIIPMLWVFALSQVYYGFVRSWQRGRQIYNNQHAELLKPMEK